jgi:hypothetical protein
MVRAGTQQMNSNAPSARNLGACRENEDPMIEARILDAWIERGVGGAEARLRVARENRRE